MSIKDYPVKTHGEYVLTPCENQFESSSKVSYWISKAGYTFAAYAFSVNKPKEGESMLHDECISGYIAHFEWLSDNIEYLNLIRSALGKSALNDLMIPIAKKLIDDFCNREYDRDDGADYSDLRNIGIAYTETENGLFPIQSSVNLVDYSVITKVNDEVVKTEQFGSLKDLITNKLSNLEFSDLVYVEESLLIPVYRKYLVGKSIVFDGKKWTVTAVNESGEALILFCDALGPKEMKKINLKDLSYAYYQQVMSTSKKLIHFKSTNIDGKERKWVFSDETELESEWLSDDCDLPANDDRIYDVQVGTSLPAVFTFEELLRYLEIIKD